MSYTVHVLDGPPALAFLTGTYSDLFRADPKATAFQSPVWLAAWGAQLPPQATPLMFVVVEDGSAVAALAMVSDETGARRRIYPLSAPASDYIRPTGSQADRPAVAEHLALAITDAADESTDLELSDVPVTSGLGKILSRVMPEDGWYQNVNQCAAVPLPVDYAAMSSATRRNHRRRQRRWSSLAERQPVVYRRSRCAEELLAGYEKLVELHAQRWEGRNLQPAAAAHQLHAVLTRCSADHAFVASLSLGGTVVAAQLCLNHRRTCYSLMPAMSPEHQALAPGHALLRHLADDLRTHAFHTLDLGRTTAGQHAYKDQYQPRWSSTLTVLRQRLLAAA
ncbi:GNAT family N-acetyltransferase [Streptomyces misionensis]|uniref:GNAT family N-acetyltransferase n=1 Tax=Streptomyces misionensis TaxID=67331 RepID=UPI0033C3F1A0